MGIINQEEIRRNLLIAAYDAAKNVSWDLSQEEFIIDENLNFTHATWKGVFCKGGDTIIATVEIINHYIEEFHKQKDIRDLSFISLV